MDVLLAISGVLLGVVIGGGIAVAVYEIRLSKTLLLDRETGKVEGKDLPDKIVVYEGEKKTTFKKTWRQKR